jgi:hypothetical protein
LLGQGSDALAGDWASFFGKFYETVAVSEKFSMADKGTLKEFFPFPLSMPVAGCWFWQYARMFSSSSQRSRKVFCVLHSSN